jgi:small acid-soluble spore protein D (minor alpha/beta-type SASP)
MSPQGFIAAGSINIDLFKNRRFNLMSKSKVNVPEARAALDKFKMEAANEVGVTLKQGYNGDLTSKQAGSVGGQMVKKMVESYENSIKNNG